MNRRERRKQGTAFNIRKNENSQLSTPNSEPHFQSFEIYIEELVLHGIARSERYRISDALERELARLFTEQGISQSLARSSEVARLDAGSFQIGQRAEGGSVGSQVARAVHKGLTR